MQQIIAVGALDSPSATIAKEGLQQQLDDCRHKRTMLKPPDEQVTALTKAVATAEAKIAATQERIDKLHIAITDTNKEVAKEETEKQFNQSDLDIVTGKLEIAKVRVMEDQKINWEYKMSAQLQ